MGLILAMGCTGVVMAHAPMIFSGFRRLQTDLGDSRYIHYMLEHGYRALVGEPQHRSFWNPPFFYPAQNVAAHSDLLLGFGPMYWVLRWSGTTQDLSFGLWMVAISALNFLAGLLLFRKGLGLSPIPAAVGAFLLAFGAPRVNRMGHPHLVACFYVLLTAFALTQLFGSRPSRQLVRLAYWALACLGVVLQLYSGFYVGWFLVAGVGLLAAGSLVLPSCRWSFLETVWRDRWLILLAGAAALLMLWPLLDHYLPLSREVSRDQPFYRGFHPHFSSWFSMGGGNWMWGCIERRGLMGSPGNTSQLHLGFGLCTVIACVLGFYLSWGRPMFRLTALVALFAWLATTYMPQYQLLSVAIAASIFCLAGLYRAIDEPKWRAAGLASYVGILLAIRTPDGYLQALGHCVMALCFLEMIRVRETSARMIIPGLVIGVLCLRFFDGQALLIVTAWIATAATLPCFYLKPYRRAIGFAALAVTILTICAITYPRRPAVWIGGLAAMPIGLAATWPRRFRPPVRVMASTLLIALLIIAVYGSSDSLWLKFQKWIPGGYGIRDIGRISVILLIPVALGVALLVERLQRTHRWAAIWAVALGCMLEQGVTTPAYDSRTNRATIAAIAAQVDPYCEAFYYHPPDRLEFVNYHLDAMFASMDIGKPTINGYSSYHPPGWQGFYMVDAPRGPDVETALEEWKSAQGFASTRIQLIGSKCTKREREIFQKPQPRVADRDAQSRLPESGKDDR